MTTDSMKSETATPEVISCAGFRIETSEEYLAVSADGSGTRPKGRQSLLEYGVHAAFAVVAVVQLLQAIVALDKYSLELTTLPDLLASPASLLNKLTDIMKLLAPLAFLAWCYFLLIRSLRKGEDDLRCTRESFDVVNHFRGRERRVTRMAPNEVKSICYGATGWSSMTGLVFSCKGKQRQILQGLKCVEAQRILRELQRLGYEVHHDPGMAMMVEMEQSRRDHPYKLLP